MKLDTAAVAKRVRALLDLGRAESALTEVRRGLSAAPTDPELAELHGLCLIRVGDLSGAITALETARASSPDRAHVHYLLGFARRQAGRQGDKAAERLAVSGAQACYREALRLDPEEPVYLRALAELLVETRDFKEGLALAERAVAAGPDRASNHITLGFVASASGDRARARRAYETAVTLDPNDSTAWNNLGCVDLADGDKLGARERFRESLRLEPGAERAKKNLGLVTARRPSEIHSDFDAFLGEVLCDLQAAGRLGDAVRALAIGQAVGAAAVGKAVSSRLGRAGASRFGLAAGAAVGAAVLRSIGPGMLLPVGVAASVAGIGYLATVRRVTPLRRLFADRIVKARTEWEASRREWLDGRLDRAARERRVERLLERLAVELDRAGEADAPASDSARATPLSGDHS